MAVGVTAAEVAVVSACQKKVVLAVLGKYEESVEPKPLMVEASASVRVPVPAAVQKTSPSKWDVIPPCEARSKKVATNVGIFVSAVETKAPPSTLTLMVPLVQAAMIVEEAFLEKD